MQCAAVSYTTPCVTRLAQKLPQSCSKFRLASGCQGQSADSAGAMAKVMEVTLQSSGLDLATEARLKKANDELSAANTEAAKTGAATFNLHSQTALSFPGVTGTPVSALFAPDPGQRLLSFRKHLEDLDDQDIQSYQKDLYLEHKTALANRVAATQQCFMVKAEGACLGSRASSSRA